MKGGPDDLEREVGEEIRYHLDRRAESLREGGMDAAAAWRRATREFGDVDAARAELTRMDRRRRARRRWAMVVADAWADLRFGTRAMARQPALTLALLLTLGVGAGAATSIFTLTDAALLRPLPYRDADRLFHVRELDATGDESEASYPDFADWKRDVRGLAGLEAYDPTNIAVAGGTGATMTRGVRVTPGFFDLLGVTAALGRSFRADEAVRGTAVVMLDHGWWRRELGGDPSVLDRTLRIDGREYRIVGVLPPDFRFVPGGDAALWLPIDPSGPGFEQRRNHELNVVGRLRTDVPLATAQASISRVMERLADIHPESNAGRDARLVPLRDEVTGDARPLVAALAGAAALLLLIACANVAALLLARSLARGPEFAARLALGASRGRLVRQLLAESVLLATGGGLLGLAVATAATIAMRGAIPDGVLDAMPYLRDVRPDPRALAFAILLSLVMGLGFGVAPAVAAWRAGASLLPAGTRATGGRRALGLRDAIVAGELALTVVLLVCTGLITRSLVRLAAENPGFRAAHVVTARVALAGPVYREAQAQQRFFESVLERARSLPGVVSVGAVTSLPLNGGSSMTYRVDGLAPPDAGGEPEAMRRGVAGDYFESMGIPIVAGRALDARDVAGAEPAIVVSDTMARELFGANGALGRRFRFGAFPGRVWTVVGVAGDVKTGRLDAAAPPTVYYSHLQAAENRLSLAVRATGDARTLMRSLSRIVASIDPGVPVYGVRGMSDVIAASPAVYARRLPLALIALFTTAALLLAAVGVYGVVSCMVAQRSRELGIRFALGATRGRLMREVLRHGATLAGVGAAAGALIAFAFARLLSSLLYGVAATDGATYAASALGLGLLAVLACVPPARRAARVSPSDLLRAD